MSAKLQAFSSYYNLLFSIFYLALYLMLQHVIFLIMQRKDFLKSFGVMAATGIIAPTGLREFKKFTSDLESGADLMPVMFMGHGSPMNGIEDNEFSQQWTSAARDIPLPKAIIVVSAHWFTRGTKVTAMQFPETIHDFGGFPEELFKVQYPSPGDPEIARETASMITKANVKLDHEWGLDHGAWTVLRRMYPDANIPVIQLSIDYTRDAQYHFELAAELAALRKLGVLIIGSGNMVHNLRMVSFGNFNGPGYEWAIAMNEKFKELILKEDYNSLIQYDKLGKEALLAIPTPEHYLPLIYTLALRNKNEKVQFFNDKAIAGSLTMTSVRIG
jgi:4,5-DOPA dioxygenase extradiol